MLSTLGQCWRRLSWHPQLISAYSYIFDFIPSLSGKLCSPSYEWLHDRLWLHLSVAWSAEKRYFPRENAGIDWLCQSRRWFSHRLSYSSYLQVMEFLIFARLIPTKRLASISVVLILFADSDHQECSCITSALQMKTNTQWVCPNQEMLSQSKTWCKSHGLAASSPILRAKCGLLEKLGTFVVLSHFLSSHSASATSTVRTQIYSLVTNVAKSGSWPESTGYSLVPRFPFLLQLQSRNTL